MKLLQSGIDENILLAEQFIISNGLSEYFENKYSKLLEMQFNSVYSKKPENETFYDLFRLEELELEDIPEICDEIFDLVNLRDLHLSCSYIEEIPKEISNLTNLTLLDLSNNRLKELPDLSNLTKLNFLFIDGNELTELNHSIFKLIELIELECGYNAIQEIPSEISNLQKLQVLSARENRIKEITPVLLNMSSLKSVEFQDNKILYEDVKTTIENAKKKGIAIFVD